MANYAILSTSSIVGDRFPYAGLRYLANNKIFDDVNPSGGKYIYSGKQTYRVLLILQAKPNYFLAESGEF